MIYSIDYIDKKNSQWCLFEIHVFVTYETGIWKVGEGFRSDCKSVCFGQCIAQYVFDKIHDEETLKEFQKDVTEMVEIRGYLHEILDNHWFSVETDKRAEEQAQERFKNVHIPAMEKKIYEFAEKYGFKVRK